MAIWQKKLKDGSVRFVLSYYPDGRAGGEKRKVLPKHIDTQEKALEFERIILEGRRHKKAAYAYGTTLRDFAKGYYAWAKVHRAGSARDRENCFKNHVLKHLGALEPGGITAGDITAYKMTRKAEGASNRSVNKEISYLRGFVNAYLSRELAVCQQLSFETEALPYDRPIPQVMDDDEAEKFLMAAEEEPLYLAFFLMLYGAGLRLNEARTLRVESVNLAAGYITVTRKGRRNKEQALPIAGWPLEALKAVIGERKTGWVFQSPVKPGKPLCDVRKAIKRIKKRAGIPEERRINPHLFRHSIATRMVGKKVDFRVIQEFLGHKEITTTEWYGQVMPEVLRENVLIISTPKSGRKRLINREKKASA